MSMVKTWYTLEEAADKFGVGQGRILEWADKGIVRTETAGGKVLRFNGDDIEMLVEEMTGI